MLFDNGLKRIKKSADIVTLVNNERRIKMLENTLFTPRQLILHNLSRYNYLSEHSDKEEIYNEMRVFN